MGKIEQIEQQVASPSPEELAVFRRSYAAFDADAWDRQLAADLESGKLDDLISEARSDYESGRAREL